MPQAPVFRHQPYADEPDYLVVDPVEPFTEINLSNMNATAMLAAILPDEDHEELYGAWEGAKLAQVQANCVRLLTNKLRRSTAYLEPVQEGNWFTGGRDEEYVYRRLSELLELVTVAQEHGFYVSYG
jgi:hypothetical protein